MSNPVYDADRAIAAALQSPAVQQSEVLHAIARTFNWWGGPGVIWFAAALWIGGRALKAWRISFIGLRGAEGIVIASALNGIAKALAGRVRPFVAPGEPWHWTFNGGWSDPHLQSMPSGHTAATIAFAAAIGIASARVERGTRLLLVSASFVSAFFVAFARTYTNQHWFSDVCAGAILGVASGAFIARWHERHPRTAFDRTLLGAPPEPAR